MAAQQPLQPQQPQPDLGRLAQDFQTAATGMQNASNQINLLGNLPPVHDRQMAANNHQQLVDLIQGLTVRLDAVDTRLDRMDIRMTAK